MAYLFPFFFVVIEEDENGQAYLYWSCSIFQPLRATVSPQTSPIARSRHPCVSREPRWRTERIRKRLISNVERQLHVARKTQSSIKSLSSCPKDRSLLSTTEHYYGVLLLLDAFLSRAPPTHRRAGKGQRGKGSGGGPSPSPFLPLALPPSL